MTNSKAKRVAPGSPARIPVGGSNTASAAISKRSGSGQGPQDTDRSPGVAGWSPLKKGAVAAGIVALAAGAVLFFTSGTAMAGGLPGGTAPPRGLPGGGSSPGGGGGGSSPGGSGGVNNSERDLTPDGIRGIQRTLRGLGYGAAPYNVTCSGALDAPTRSAVRAFQGAYNRDAAGHADWAPRTLKVDGIVGPQTRQALTHYARFYDSGSC